MCFIGREPESEPRLWKFQIRFPQRQVQIRLDLDPQSWFKNNRNFCFPTTPVDAHLAKMLKYGKTGPAW